MTDKKLIATTVSSREKGLKRREEGKTTSSQRKISTQGNQDECRMKHTEPEDDSPIQRRDRKHDIDEETRRTDDMRSKGGGRLKHCTVDGDVPLCLRRKLEDNKESSSSESKRYEGKGSGSGNQKKNEELCHEQIWRAEVKNYNHIILQEKICTRKIRKSPSSFFKKT